jgi:hypothetical protein
MLSIIDKLFFSCGLIFFMQVPKFVNTDYAQWLSGYYESTSDQVKAWTTISRQYEFPSLQDMISAHLKNTDSSVAAVAREQQQTIDLLDQLKSGVEIFQKGSLFQKIKWMLSPDRIVELQKPLSDFQPGVPLDTASILFGLTGAFVLSLSLVTPIKLATRKAT